jgi:CDGSH-type Zn-finger protein
MSDDVRALRAAVSLLHTETTSATADRLADSVLRPLNELLGEPPPTGGPARSLWDLAVWATELSVTNPAPALVEATAALQDLACHDPGDLERLRALQEDVEPGVQVAPNGPYLVTNAAEVRDHLGRPLATRPRMALCRCGASQRKPLCDGSHARVGFGGSVSPGRIADRLDTYVGQQVTVYDNRGVCQFSRLCSDRLATVFRQDTEPFVAPSGGRMDEIIRAVRDCPSGALSYGIDGAEERAAVDHHHHRRPAIEVTRDGPYRVTGGLPLRDGDGADVVRGTGASREHYALCRCGESPNQPFCVGTHREVGFCDPVADPDARPTVFEWCGGLPALVRMTRVFYEKYVPQDPLLAPRFATMSADHPERVAAWLGEVFGGPKSYSEGYGGYPRMLSQHRGKALTEQERARWVELLLRSAHDAGLPNDPEFRAAFGSYVEWGSRLAVENSQTDARPPEHMPMPHWDWQTAAGPPGSRLPALAARDEPQVIAPAEGEPVGFQAHIRPMFRSVDRESMSGAFDLWSVDDVRAHADAIHARLAAGTMPCDGAWPRDRLAVFERWQLSGMGE